MASNDKPSTLLDFKSDSSDEGEEHLENLSTEQICNKIKTLRNLCLENKVNVKNAFDINMIGYFHSWFEKKKGTIFDDNNDFTSFQEISDYLEASAKIYSYRIDNVTETTSRLVEEFKSMNYKKSTTPEDDDNAMKMQKSKRRGAMLTTNEKLRRKPNENKTTFYPDLIDHNISSFNINELLSTGHLSSSLMSMYSGKSLAEEMKDFEDQQKEFDEKKTNEETIEVPRSFIDILDELLEESICPEFKGFVAERDKIDSNDDKLDGIEYRFDPNDYQFQNNSEESVCDDNKPDNNELDSNSNDEDKNLLDGLLDCIDNVDRDYSFFNPKLLANWNGPKAWKAQAMMKALKSCTPTERKEIEENIDECTQQNIKQSKTIKKCNRVKHDRVKINWLNKSQITEILENNLEGNEKILTRTLKNWDPLDHIADSQTIDVDIKYKFDFLQYIEIIPDWWIHKNRKKGICSEASNSSQNINDCGESIVEPLDSVEIKDEDPEQLTNENYDGTDDKLDESEELNSGDDNVMGDIKSEDEDGMSGIKSKNENVMSGIISENEDGIGDKSGDENVMGDIKSESRMDIAELKKEISDIIDEECVETDPKSEWSSKLSFFNLLVKLRINEREELSIPIVFVGLLHLANERGLKLIQEHCIINDIEETFIIKPMK
ncbi:hypothetical protein QTP88_000380 [Uroleucon formosanum]